MKNTENKQSHLLNRSQLINYARFCCLLVSVQLLSTIASATNFGVKKAILVEVDSVSSPPSVNLTWPLRTDVISYTVKRTTPNADPVVITRPPESTGYLDTAVSVATPYEYQISAQLIGSTAFATAFIAAGIDLPLAPERGVVLLMVDSTIATPLASEIERFEQDLNGDGWRFETHLVDPATATPPDVRNLIIARHAADPDVCSVILLGKIPVPYSGRHSPDGHSSHYGAWPSDSYYGDIDGTWTDTSVDTTVASRPANHNVPGDGKFDQSILPSDVDLAVGRIDLANLPSYAPLTEIDLLRRYLDKNHAYRHSNLSTGKCALIDDHLSTFSEGFAAPPRASFTSILGGNEVQDGNWHTVASVEPQLFGAGIGSGSYSSVSGVTTTAQTAAAQSSVTFSLLFGSYFGDWDNGDNVLRAQLGTTAGGLATMYSGRPIWQLHSLGHGETLGHITRQTVNARYLAPYPTGYSAYRTHVALMGDPTLRLFPVATPESTIAILEPTGSATVHWSPPATVPDGLIGYQVYRCPSPNSPPVLLTPSPTTDHQFVDPTPLPSGSSYLVKTVVLQETASSSYQNSSQASFAELTPATSYATWSTNHYPAQGTAPQLGDSDADLLPNLLEYATGTDPTSYDPGVSFLGATATQLNFCYTIDLSATDATVEPQVSSNLVDWQPLNDLSSIQIVQHSSDENLRLIKFSIDRQATDRVFVRLRVTANSS